MVAPRIAAKVLGAGSGSPLLAVGKFSKQFPGDKASEPGTLVFMYRLDRRAKVIRSVYGVYHAAARIRQEERHQEIIAKP